MSAISRGGCGCLLLVLSVVALVCLAFFPVAVEVFPGISGVLETVLCGPDEGLSLNGYDAATQPGRFNISGEFYCISETAKRDISDHVVAVGAGLFLVLHMIGWWLFRTSVIPWWQRYFNPWNETTTDTLLDDPSLLTSNDRLEQVKRAYDTGLIDQTEYDMKRKEILDDI